MTAEQMHGRKRRFQVLLDPNRAKLFDSLAEQQSLKTSAFLRDQLYEALELLVPRAIYDKAKEADAQIRVDWIEQQADLRRKRK